jgi:hypothetical protein
VTHPAEAQTKWREARDARSAAGALMGVGLVELARPHVVNARANALECLWVYHTGQPPGEDIADGDLPSWQAEDPCPDTWDCADLLAWIGRVESRIGKKV